MSVLPLPSLEEARHRYSYNPETGALTTFYAANGNKQPNARVAGSRLSSGYWQVQHRRKFILAHRLIWFIVTGDWPVNKIDHINGDPSDNRWINLRQATHSQNMMNARLRRDNTSGHKGVHYLSKKKVFQPFIQINGRTLHAKACSTLSEAIKARAALEARYHGEFARVPHRPLAEGGER